MREGTSVAAKHIRTWPAVSQICSFTVDPLIMMVRIWTDATVQRAVSEKGVTGERDVGTSRASKQREIRTPDVSLASNDTNLEIRCKNIQGRRD